MVSLVTICVHLWLQIIFKPKLRKERKNSNVKYLTSVSLCEVRVEKQFSHLHFIRFNHWFSLKSLTRTQIKYRFYVKEKFSLCSLFSTAKLFVSERKIIQVFWKTNFFFSTEINHSKVKNLQNATPGKIESH